ncbi:hypothetical protein EDD11_008590 [Mortierella claussenii]|nr:hypothetical protein EDD11_008590 [Mortierella claussenii]
MAQRARLQGRESVVLYSDGSLDHAGKEDVSMAFGVVIKDNDDQYSTVASGRVERLASLTQAAKEGPLSELWSLKEEEHNDFLCHAKINDTIVEDDVRRVLKRQSVIRNNTAWTKQNRTAAYIPDWQAVDWKATLNIVHNGQTPRSLFTSPDDCQKRAHRIKKIHGMLPTLSYMKNWRPDLYDTDICRMCELEVEDIEHIWTCAITRGEQMESWNKAVAEVKRKQWKEKQKCQEGQGQQPSKKRRPQFTALAETTIWRMLESKVLGVTTIRCADENLDEADESRHSHDISWTVRDLYHGRP